MRYLTSYKQAKLRNNNGNSINNKKIFFLEPFLRSFKISVVYLLFMERWCIAWTSFCLLIICADSSVFFSSSHIGSSLAGCFVFLPSPTAIEPQPKAQFSAKAFVQKTKTIFLFSSSSRVCYCFCCFYYQEIHFNFHFNETKLLSNSMIHVKDERGGQETYWIPPHHHCSNATHSFIHLIVFTEKKTRKTFTRKSL